MEISTVIRVIYVVLWQMLQVNDLYQSCLGRDVLIVVVENSSDSGIQFEPTRISSSIYLSNL